ncbi:MAG TPA: hypothetical protein VF252_12695, partial [Gemmatimonadales bacterium]
MATQLERRAGEAGFEDLEEDPRETLPPRRARPRHASSSPGEAGDERLARGLGWFSIGLGLAQITAPRSIARLIGVSDEDETRNTMFAIGLREIASGVGILSRPNPAPFLWSRVGGDIMDLALLGKELGSAAAKRPRVAAVTAAVLGVTLLDLYASQEFSRTGAPGGKTQERGVRLRVAITVNCPVERAY